MHDKIQFIAQHYASLLLFGIAFWGLGHAMVAACTRQRLADPWLHHALCLTLGMGLATMAFQWMAAGGGLRRGNINVVLITGCLLALGQAIRAYRRRDDRPAARVPWETFLYVLLPLLLALPTVFEALRPPYRGDELMYQLPNARQWAQTGTLSVNEWLRYPWAAHSQGVLYAAGYIVRGDIFPHVLHSLAGWLTALMVFRCALQPFGCLAACLSSSAWLLLTHNQYDSAYVDMAVSVFVFAAFIACLHWTEARDDRGWLLLSGFLLGCSAAVKYHALGFVPFFLIAILLSSRSLASAVQWLAAAAPPCIYWYARNAWMTGDPFNPLGGRVFGFHDWNLGDLRYQLLDLKWNANWPAWYLWPAALALCLPGTWKSAATRCMVAFGVYGFAVWWATSHYDRYLMPTYPVLAVLSAGAFVTVGRLVMRSGPVRARMLPAIAVGILIGLQWPHTAQGLQRAWSDMAFQPAARERFLRMHVQSYGLSEALRGKDLGKVYQYGMDSGIYYFPNPVYGDHFGPWRYREVGLAEPNPWLAGLDDRPAQSRGVDPVDRSAAGIAAKLASGGFKTLLLQRQLVPAFEAKPDFGRHFAEIAEGNGDKAYAIRSTSP